MHFGVHSYSRQGISGFLVALATLTPLKGLMLRLTASPIKDVLGKTAC